MMNQLGMIPRLTRGFIAVCLILITLIGIPAATVARAAAPQLLISEIFTNPANDDSPFEYVELLATGAIDFSATPYSVVFTNNNTADTTGWIIGGNGIGSAKSYAFSITSGTVSTGQIVYVGGVSMAPTGTKLRVLDTGNVAGDGFGDASTQGVLGNGGANADGVAVFALPVASLTSSSVPVDALFFGTGAGTAVVSGGAAGYELPINDYYAGGKLQFSSFIAPNPVEVQALIASGAYDLGTDTWTTPRTWTNNLPTDHATAITFGMVTASPMITTQPQSQTITNGATTAFTVAASGAGPLYYQWYQGATGDTSAPIIGATDASYTTPALTATTIYWVQVAQGSPAGDSINSATATATVTHGALRIRDIQGAAYISPLVSTVNDNLVSLGQSVADAPGIVTAVVSNGFYMQDPSPDDNPATSEGIFVFTGTSGAKPAVGAAVTVSGRAAEVRPLCTSASCTSASSAWNNLTTTEITAGGGETLTWTRSSLGNALPAPIVIGNGGRVLPAQVIEDDANGDVETTPNTFDPATDGLDFYESLEGMRVQVNDAVVVGPTTSNGEIAVLGDNGANAGLRTARGGVIIAASDFNPERIIVDDVLTPNPPTVNVGDRFAGAIVGVMDYSFGNFKLLNTATLPIIASGKLAQETTIAATTSELSVASFNVENLSPNDSTQKFTDLANIVVKHLQAPDVIAVEEIQDNNGATNDAVTSADQTFAKLITAITAASGPTYQFRAIDPVDDQDGGQPGGNIRVGFLFRTDRGLTFVDRAGGTPTAAVSVVAGADGPQLSLSPGRIEPTNAAFASSRKPLAGEFTFQGKTLFVIANHFNSKGGDQPLFGRFQPPTLSSETQRVQQAQIVNGFVKALLAQDTNARVVVLGDFNDFTFSKPLQTLSSGALTDLMTTLPANERYSYVFDGNSQDLDHILVSSRLLADGALYDVVHVNAEFANQTSDHDPGVVRLNFANTPVTPTPVAPTPVTPTPVAPTPVTRIYMMYLPVTGR